MENVKEMLTKYWWALAAVVVLYMTMGSKNKRKRTRRYTRRARVGMRRMRRMRR